MLRSVSQWIPELWLGLGTRNQSFAESNGHYERVPIRVGEFTLAENEKGRVVFETTAQDFCREGPKVEVIIDNEGYGWSVKEHQGCHMTYITPSVDLHSEKLARRRAFWHAGQYMSGVQLSHSETFSNIHQGYEDDPDLFDDDAFFRHGEAVTIDPFGDFLPK